MSSPHTTQAPTTQEIETSFIQALSNGPLSLEAITDHMSSLGPGHEDAVVAVFEYMIEPVAGETTYQLRPEYLPTTTASSGNQATPSRKTPPAPLSFARSPARSPTLSSPLSSPPTHLSSPASTPPPRPRPRYTSSPLSSPPPTPELRSPTPPPARPVRRTQRAARKGKGKEKASTTAMATAIASATSSRVTKKSGKGKGKGKKGGMAKVQCSGVTKRKTRCGFRKMCEVGQTWDCGRHG